jgi:hypothetical protein
MIKYYLLASLKHKDIKMIEKKDELSKIKLIDVLPSLDSICFWIKIDGIYVHASKSANKIRGIPIEGLSDYDFLERNICDQTHYEDEYVLLHKENYTSLIRYKTRSSIFILKTLKIPIISEGKALGILGVIDDVTLSYSTLTENNIRASLISEFISSYILNTSLSVLLRSQIEQNCFLGLTKFLLEIRKGVLVNSNQSISQFIHINRIKKIFEGITFKVNSDQNYRITFMHFCFSIISYIRGVLNIRFAARCNEKEEINIYDNKTSDVGVCLVFKTFKKVSLPVQLHRIANSMSLNIFVDKHDVLSIRIVEIRIQKISLTMTNKKFE